MIELTEDYIEIRGCEANDGKNAYLMIRSKSTGSMISLKQQILKWQEDSKKLEKILELINSLVHLHPNPDKYNFLTQRIKKILNEDSEEK